MPGADQPLRLVPLHADGDAFTILGRFPVGFARVQPGGYLAAEDVIVLDGGLELEGRWYGPTSLVHIPAGYRRTSMRTPAGCLVLAWFGGPALFRPPDELPTVPEAEVRAVECVRSDDGVLLRTEDAHWSVMSAAERPPEADAVDPELTMWVSAGSQWPGPEPARLVVRAPRA